MNEKISVKIVVFEHPEPQKWGKYCGYCAETNDFQGRGKTIEEVVSMIRKHLLFDLRHRFQYDTLQNLGWEITNDSIKAPSFTPEEAVKLTEVSYEVKLKYYQIIEVHVRIPKQKSPD